MSGPETLILAIGNPMLDMAAPLGREAMEKYDLPYGGAVLAEEKHQPLFEEILAHKDLKTTPGGSAMNTVRCAQHMLKESHPESCLYFGCIGKDKTGERVKEGVKEEGLKASWNEVDQPTAKCAVVVHEGERALCCDVGASSSYELSHMEENMELVRSAKILYSTGFFILSNFEALKLAANTALEGGKLFGINLSANWVCETQMPKLLELMEYADFIFGNEDETACFAKCNGIEFSELKEVTQYIAKLPKKNGLPRTVITTHGKKPVITAVFDPATSSLDLQHFEVTEVPAEKIEDLNGAGDAFVGGFLGQVVLGSPLAKCVEAGLYLSGDII